MARYHYHYLFDFKAINNSTEKTIQYTYFIFINIFMINFKGMWGQFLWSTFISREGKNLLMFTFIYNRVYFEMW